MTLVTKSTPGRRKALRALAAAKRKNKRRMAEGKKPIVEGRLVDPSTLTKARLRRHIAKHYGPGAHPGTGTDQTVHDPGTGSLGGGGEDGGGLFGGEDQGQTQQGGAEGAGGGQGPGEETLGGADTGLGESAVPEQTPSEGADLFDVSVAPPPSNVPAEIAEPETSLDQEIRPLTFDDFVGQNNLKDQLSIMAGAAKTQGRAMPHVLFSGPPGLGKTTLANIIGNEMGREVKIVTAGALNQESLVGTLLSLEEGDILFIDEIHALDDSTAELLYPVMEDFEMDIPLGRGTVRREVPEFTLIGATTRAGDLPDPLRDRFAGGVGRLEYYKPQELAQIAERTSGVLDVEMEPDAFLAIGERSRGTPRIANNLTKFVRDYAVVNELPSVTSADVDAALSITGVDGAGLARSDRRFLSYLAETGRPVGVNTIASVMGEDPVTVEDAWEPYLLQAGFVARTPRGRIITDKGLAHLEEYGDFQKAITNDDPMRCLVVNCLKDHLRVPAKNPEEGRPEDPFPRTQENGGPISKHGGPGPHKSGTPQSVHGNWSRGTSARQMLEDAASSGDPRSGERGLTRYVPSGTEPESGVGVGMTERSRWFPSQPSQEDVRQYVSDNSDLLFTPGYHVGFWEAPDGRWSLDVSQVFDSADEAFATYPNEEAVFDFSTFETIYNPGL